MRRSLPRPGAGRSRSARSPPRAEAGNGAQPSCSSQPCQDRPQKRNPESSGSCKWFCGVAVAASCKLCGPQDAPATQHWSGRPCHIPPCQQPCQHRTGGRHVAPRSITGPPASCRRAPACCRPSMPLPPSTSAGPASSAVRGPRRMLSRRRSRACSRHSGSALLCFWTFRRRRRWVTLDQKMDHAQWQKKAWAVRSSC